jgi:hypothetical protein
MSSAGVLLGHRGEFRTRRARPTGARVAPATAAADRELRRPRVVAVFVGAAGTRASAEAPQRPRPLEAVLA